jgi:hypothetical protein
MFEARNSKMISVIRMNSTVLGSVLTLGIRYECWRFGDDFVLHLFEHSVIQHYLHELHKPTYRTISEGSRSLCRYTMADDGEEEEARTLPVEVSIAGEGR